MPSNEERWSKSFYAKVFTPSGRLLNFTYPKAISGFTGGKGKYGVAKERGGAGYYEGVESLSTEYLIATDYHDDKSRLYFRYLADDSGEACYTLHTVDQERVTISNRDYLYKTPRSDWANSFKLYDPNTGGRLDLSKLTDATHQVKIRSTSGDKDMDTYQWNKVGEVSWSYLSLFARGTGHDAVFTLEISDRGKRGFID